MPTQDDAKTYDLRVIERKLRRGLLSRKDYERYLKGLLDRADNVTHVNPFGSEAAAEEEDDREDLE
jgi:hypothetical protein